MIRRRTIVAVIVFIIGAAVYLMASGAPPRVHVVTMASEFCLFALVTFFLCVPSMKAVHRMIGAAFGVTLLAVISTWLSSKVIAALNPLEPIYFVMGLVGFVVQAVVFAGVVWTIDFAIEHTRPSNRASEEG
ncbi:MAG: hypothetical protein QOE68_221 [Thermoanaerobaculia bacterium]|jgi:hypothetical protein|nr:hypothetical protein [Thermoanaerobaculia bacterium]